MLIWHNLFQAFICPHLKWSHLSVLPDKVSFPVSLPHYQRTLPNTKLKENCLLYKINILYTIANNILSNLKRERSASKITWDLRNKDKISVCNCYLKKRKFILECILHKIMLKIFSEKQNVNYF